ncbi:MAG: DUF3127 domain-containing protein [Tannerella sp.]|jgi:hypothetical protein|nr:DUF3127 domain-containing protein [Tannerella sp.]
MEIRGKIIAVSPLQTGEGRNGVWKKQEYVVEYDQTSQYPRKMVFNLWGDKIEQFNIQEGQSLKVSFDIDCREYNGRWYNDIRAWKVEADDGTPEEGGRFQPYTEMPAVKPDVAPPDESSDLPF